MSASDYQRCAERTMIDPNNEHRMVNAALGLCGEAAELDQVVLAAWGDVGAAKLTEEAGDLLWYVAQMCKAIGKSIASVPADPDLFIGLNEDRTIEVLYRNTGWIADVVKKRVFHERPFNPLQMMQQLSAVVGAVQHILEIHNLRLEEAFDANNAKLLKRHPDGFSAATANARADETSS